MSRFALLALPLTLAACDASFKADANDGNVSVHSDGNGSTSIDVPGFSAKMKLPRAMMAAGDFDIDGVRLPKTSTIGNFDLDGGDGGALIDASFTDTGSPQSVRDHYSRAFAARGIKLGGDANTLTGTTKGGATFRITTQPGTNGGTAGTIRIEDHDGK